MRIVFSILHYKNFDVTNNCVKSLLSLKQPTNCQIEIVLVLNPISKEDESILLLEKEYKANKNIKLLKNKENLGFSGGNNIGFLFSKENLNPDFLIVMNNDILIKDKDILKKIMKIDNCDIIAPKIINLEGINQNPFREKKLNKKQVLSEWLKINLLYFIYHFKFLAKLYLEIKNKKKKGEDNKVIKNFYNIVPHGSFIIYKKNYIENERFAFVPGTFLYAEEDLLAWYIKKKRYITYYDETIEIHHLESVSTSKIDNNIIRNLKKVFKYKKDSISLLLRKEFLE